MRVCAVSALWRLPASYFMNTCWLAPRTDEEKSEKKAKANALKEKELGNECYKVRAQRWGVARDLCAERAH